MTDKVARVIDLRLRELSHVLQRDYTGLHWDFGDYPHFNTPRGFGVTFQETDGFCWMRYAKKLEGQDIYRIDGIVRHELGHVVDMCEPAERVDQLLRIRGLPAIKTPERRADIIAYAVWGLPIYYDKELVQNSRSGTTPRPAHLGL